jgi:hypothetical protein
MFLTCFSFQFDDIREDDEAVQAAIEEAKRLAAAKGGKAQ